MTKKEHLEWIDEEIVRALDNISANDRESKDILANTLYLANDFCSFLMSFRGNRIDRIKQKPELLGEALDELISNFMRCIPITEITEDEPWITECDNRDVRIEYCKRYPSLHKVCRKGQNNITSTSFYDDNRFSIMEINELEIYQDYNACLQKIINEEVPLTLPYMPDRKAIVYVDTHIPDYLVVRTFKYEKKITKINRYFHTNRHAITGEILIEEIPKFEYDNVVKLLSTINETKVKMGCEKK